MPCLVSLTTKGFFLFRFRCQVDLDKALSSNPSLVGKWKIHLLRWYPGMDDVPLPKSTAVWIRFRIVPYHLWCSNIFQALANSVGKPIKMDDITASYKMLGFARLLVEVDISKPLPSLIWIDLEGEEPIDISVEYENLRCSHCLFPGHSESICPQRPSSKTPPSFPISPPSHKINSMRSKEAQRVSESDPSNTTCPSPYHINPFELLDIYSMKDHFCHHSPKHNPSEEELNLLGQSVSESPLTSPPLPLSVHPSPTAPICQGMDSSLLSIPQVLERPSPDPMTSVAIDP